MLDRNASAPIPEFQASLEEFRANPLAHTTNAVKHGVRAAISQGFQHDYTRPLAAALGVSCLAAIAARKVLR